MSVPKVWFSQLQHDFRGVATKIIWAAQSLETKMLLVTGILLAICASAGYLFLHDERSIADRLALEDPVC